MQTCFEFIPSFGRQGLVTWESSCHLVSVPGETAWHYGILVAFDMLSRCVTSAPASQREDDSVSPQVTKSLVCECLIEVGLEGY